MQFCFFSNSIQCSISWEILERIFILAIRERKKTGETKANETRFRASHWRSQINSEGSVCFTNNSNETDYSDWGSILANSYSTYTKLQVFFYSTNLLIVTLFLRNLDHSNTFEIVRRFLVRSCSFNIF